MTITGGSAVSMNWKRPNMAPKESKLQSLQRTLRLVMPWVGRSFPGGICPFCARNVTVDDHRSDCLLYRTWTKRD